MIPWPTIIIGAALVAFGAMQTFRLQVAKTELARSERDKAQQIATWEKARADGEVKTRQREAELQAEVDVQRSILDAAKESIDAKDRAITRLRTDVGSLSDDIRAFATKHPAAESLAAAQARIEELGGLAAASTGALAERREDLRECAKDAQARGAAAIALEAAWPK